MPGWISSRAFVRFVLDSAAPGGPAGARPGVGFAAPVTRSARARHEAAVPGCGPQRPANAPASRSRNARGFRPARRSTSPVTTSKPPCTSFSWIDRIVPTMAPGNPVPSSPRLPEIDEARARYDARVPGWATADD